MPNVGTASLLIPVLRNSLNHLKIFRNSGIPGIPLGKTGIPEIPDSCQNPFRNQEFLKFRNSTMIPTTKLILGGSCEGSSVCTSVQNSLCLLITGK